jgi:hypothetical protein
MVVLMGLSLLFFPPYYKMMKMGDHVATKDYVENFMETVTGNLSFKRVNSNAVVPIGSAHKTADKMVCILDIECMILS